jgi:hypothetical protein
VAPLSQTQTASSFVLVDLEKIVKDVSKHRCVREGQASNGSLNKMSRAVGAIGGGGSEEEGGSPMRSKQLRSLAAINFNCRQILPNKSTVASLGRQGGEVIVSGEGRRDVGDGGGGRGSGRGKEEGKLYFSSSSLPFEVERDVGELRCGIAMDSRGTRQRLRVRRKTRKVAVVAVAGGGGKSIHDWFRDKLSVCYCAEKGSLPIGRIEGFGMAWIVWGGGGARGIEERNETWNYKARSTTCIYIYIYIYIYGTCEIYGGKRYREDRRKQLQR